MTRNDKIAAELRAVRAEHAAALSRVYYGATSEVAITATADATTLRAAADALRTH